MRSIQVCSRWAILGSNSTIRLGKFENRTKLTAQTATGKKMAKRKPKSTNRSDDRKPRKKRSVKKRSKSVKKVIDDRPRLQRVMASAGIGSRRECELIIEEGRVEIDGQIVTKLGMKVDPDKQQIFVDAQRLVVQGLQYFILNKPAGVLSTSKDPSGRARVIDLINTDKRVYNVGRLDKASEGLILVTNDGELANRLTHPRYGIEKKYQVQVAGVPAPQELRKLEQGVYLAEGVARAAKVKFLKRAKNGCWLEMILDEGRNREIRRMLASIGHKVRVLKRVAIGPLKLGDLPIGAHRRLFPNELRALRRAASGEVKKRKPKKKPIRRDKRKDDSDEKDSTRTASGKRSFGTKKTVGSRSKKKTSKKSSSDSKRKKSKRGAARNVVSKPKRGKPKRTKRRK